MTERVVSIKLTAQVSNYLANMEAARKKGKEVGDTLEKQQAASIAAAQAQGEAAKKLGAGLLAVGTLAAVGVGLAIKKFAEFDQAMSNVQAATHESTENMGLLREAALDAGASTVFSATEAANAVEELGKAGLTTSEILKGGLNGALDLAAAGGLGVAEAAGYAAIAMKQFGLEGAQVPHVADLLAAGAGKAVGDVSDLAQALNQAGLVANGAGFSIEETTGVLAAFADAGLLGSDAGTSLKTSIVALQAPSTKAAAAMEKYKISVYDGNGEMLSFAEIADQLQTKLGDVDDQTRNAALATIFGNDALRAANVLYKQGSTGIQKYVDQTNDAGYAAETAAMRLDNLAGDIEALGGAFDTALIKSGAAANDSLRFLTQSVTNLVDVFNEADPVVQNAALVVGALTAVVGIGGGAFLIAVPKVAAYRTALADLGPTAKTASVAVAAVGRAVGVLAVAAVAVTAVDALAKLLADKIGPSAEETTNALLTAASAADQFRAAINERYSKDMGADEAARQAAGLADALRDAASNSANWMDGISTGSAEILASVSLMSKEYGALAATNLPKAQAKFRSLAESANLSKDAQWELLKNMPELKAALTSQATELGLTASGADEASTKTALLGLAFGKTKPVAVSAADAYLKVADEAAGLDDQLLSLIDTINKANGVGQDAVSANNAYESALFDLDEQIRKATEGLDENKDGIADYTNTLDQSTQAGRDNEDMLVELAQKSQDAADKQFALDGSTADYKKTLEAGHQAVVDRAIALGATADEAQILADKIYAIPSEAQFKIIADTADAEAKVGSLLTALGKIPTAAGTYGQGLGVLVSNTGAGTPSKPLIARATGGILPGRPSAVDSILLHAAPGEYITNAAQTAIPSNRAALEYMNAGGTIQGFTNGGMVSGRDVQYVPSYPSGGGFGSGSSSRTVNSTVNVTAIGPDANEVATAVQRKQNWELRNG